MTDRAYPSWCCQRCGENIGWMGRFLFPCFHECVMDKKAWWEELKAKIGLGIKPREERGGFYIGQRVRMSARGRESFPRSTSTRGVVVNIKDLSDIIKHDDPHGTRDFTLTVKLDGRVTTLRSNGAHWEPER